MEYPATRRGEVVDDYHGTKVADPYRWLEDDVRQSAEVAAWVEAQNKITFAHLEAIPQRERIQNRLTELWNYEKFSTPSKVGRRYFFFKNDGLQNQDVLYVQPSLEAEPRMLLDPNAWSKDGTVALAGLSVSDDARWLAYGVAQAGSDWKTWRVLDIDSGKELADELKWVKFSGASWTNDNRGFFYSRYDEPKQGAEYTSVNYYPKFYFHKVNTPQSQDVLIYERPDQKEWGIGGGVSEDGRFIVLSISQGTDPKNRLFVRDLKSHPLTGAPTEQDKQVRAVETQIQAAVAALESGADKAKAEEVIAGLRAKRAELVAAQGNMSFGFVELLNDFDASYEWIGNDGTTAYFSTNLEAPRSRVIAIDLTKPARANWKELIPQAAETLQGCGMVGDFFFASYLKDAKTQVKQFDTGGKLVREVKFPGIGSAGGFGGKRTDADTFYSFTTYNVPPQIFRYDIKTGESKLWKAPAVKFNPDDYVVKQEFYASKDGTKVPMFIVHKKSTKLDGNNPTLLYGYGGFNIPLTPGFSPGTLAWLEMGGVYAVANIRGGGEYGEEWHKAGTLTQKQNVFDDFIAAAEYLIAQKYTSKGKIACQGGSNGGLLVGAMVTQRPDLWGACLPAVGVLDMLRFQKFTIGWAWKSDYGDTEGDKAVFEAVYKYSPYHLALRTKGAKWPPTLITTGDHDDRVVPAHSFKFAAALQATQTGASPVLIRIDVRAGHGAGKPTAKRIEELADTWAFLAKNLGMSMN
ncbi:MAG: S9 family peptidase [Phycisphaerales bacterium]|nr:S9 family peptidase [Phycisphaerales bacterium]